MASGPALTWRHVRTSRARGGRDVEYISVRGAIRLVEFECLSRWEVFGSGLDGWTLGDSRTRGYEIEGSYVPLLNSSRIFSVVNSE
jgi:hypothetical protein